MTDKENNTVITSLPITQTFDDEQLSEIISFPSELIDSNLQVVLKSRYVEAKKCIDNSPLAAIMLCGSLLEGLLLGIAQKHPLQFNKSAIAPKNKENNKVKPFADWSLAQFIDVSHELGYIRLDVKNFNHELRNFRNYIHPYQQLKENFNPDHYTAKMCLTAIEATISQQKYAPRLGVAWKTHQEAMNLALVCLLGSWDECNPNDTNKLSSLLNISYEDWLSKARDILHQQNSPLKLKNGIWTVTQKEELLGILAFQILDADIEKFKTIAIEVLREENPAFELPEDQRYAASVYGKVFKNSGIMRQGIAEGVALLGSKSKLFTQCSLSNPETTALLIVRELLDKACWQQWASINNFLPDLAEAAPNEFLRQIDDALSQTPCVFDSIFAQEGNGLTGSNYMTGLLWALEGLAWEEQYLVRVCCILAELAARDPGGRWSNRPANSIVTILLPWLPQTLASIEKRKVAVQTIVSETPNVGWKLLLKLLPGQHQTSSGSHKPKWRKIIIDTVETVISHKDYLEQASFHADFVVKKAEGNFECLLELINHLGHLPQPAFDTFIKFLSSDEIQKESDGNKRLLWDKLTLFTKKHRKFSDADWALSDKSLVQIEEIAKKVQPSDPLNLYQYLFSSGDYDLYEAKGNWDVQREKLDEKRQQAIKILLSELGLKGVIDFIGVVSSPESIGSALGSIADNDIDEKLLPNYLGLDDQKYNKFIASYLWRRRYIHGWEWADNLRKTDWTKGQLSQFLSYLPFNQSAWQRAGSWLQDAENEYWIKTSANSYDADDSLDYAVEKLIQYGRPRTALNCISKLVYDKKPISNNVCIRALMAAINSNEPENTLDQYNIIDLIKHLQSDPSIDEADLFRVEWAYLPLLDGYSGAKPTLLEYKLAGDPNFFCELIQLICPSENDDTEHKERSEEKKAIARNASTLFSNWHTVPGVDKSGHFDSEKFKTWLTHVKEICKKSGHYKAAMTITGKVLIHAPEDPTGLWVHRDIAEALNDKEAVDMRLAYRIEKFNSRGASWVDPTGTPEKELADHFRQQANKLEDESFRRFSVTIKELADIYEHQAERTISDHGDSD